MASRTVHDLYEPEDQAPELVGQLAEVARFLTSLFHPAQKGI